MKKSSLIIFVVGRLLAFMFLAIEFAWAQSSDHQRSPLTINTDLVVTWAQVTNRNDGSPVRGLEFDDFLLREEGKPQKISFVKESQPLSVIILVDSEVCVWPPEIELQRSQEALRLLGTDAEIALMAFDSDVVLVWPFTRDHQAIADRLGNRVGFFQALNGPRKVPRPGRDANRPGEAIYQAAQYLERQVAGERRKIIIVISKSWSWMARSHRHTAAEVEYLLEKTGTTVYALLENRGIRSGYGSDEYNPVSWFRVRKDKQQQSSGGSLEDFVDLTGGSALVSTNRALTNVNALTPNLKFGKEFDELFIKLTGLIGSSYTIGYYPENSDFDGRFRRIHLELTKAGKVKAGQANLKTRSGYRALRPSSPDVAETKN
jgi:VWFA-related protein